MDRGVWWATVQRVAKSQTWLSDQTTITTVLILKFPRRCWCAVRVESPCPRVHDSPQSCHSFEALRRVCKGDTDIKNRLLDSVGEGKGGVIWEKSIETYTLPYVKIDSQWEFDIWLRSPKTSALWQLGGMRWGGGGRWVKNGGGHMYMHGQFILMYGKNHRNIIK